MIRPLPSLLGFGLICAVSAPAGAQTSPSAPPVTSPPTLAAPAGRNAETPPGGIPRGVVTPPQGVDPGMVARPPASVAPTMPIVPPSGTAR